MKKKFVIFILIFLMSLFLSACGSSKQIEELNENVTALNEKIVLLEKENEELRGKLNLYRIETNKDGNNEAFKETSSIEEEYINNLIELYDLKSGYYNSLIDGRVPGVKFKIKNNGTKTLKEVQVTIYYKNSEGIIIHESEFTPVLLSEYSFLSDSKELKPGYIWQLESDRFYSDKSVPSEWATGSVEAKITHIEFLEE